MSAGIIHGDIKPLNALVFDGDGKRIVKLADFGDASICDNEQSLALLPKSVPWDPPEHHYRGIPYQEAKKMDIYSFGLLCLWVILGDYLYLSLDTSRPHPSGKSSDDRQTTVDILATVRRTREIQEVAKECVLACESLTREQRFNLDRLFTVTLAEDSKARSTDFGTLFKILCDDNDTGIQMSPNCKLVSGKWIHRMDDPSRRKSLGAPHKKHWAIPMRQLTAKDQWDGFHANFNVSLLKTSALMESRQSISLQDI